MERKQAKAARRNEKREDDDMDASNGAVDPMKAPLDAEARAAMFEGLF